MKHYKFELDSKVNLTVEEGGEVISNAIVSHDAKIEDLAKKMGLNLLLSVSYGEKAGYNDPVYALAEKVGSVPPSLKKVQKVITPYVQESLSRYVYVGNDDGVNTFAELEISSAVNNNSAKIVLKYGVAGEAITITVPDIDNWTSYSVDAGDEGKLTQRDVTKLMNAVASLMNEAMGYIIVHRVADVNWVTIRAYIAISTYGATSVPSVIAGIRNSCLACEPYSPIQNRYIDCY